MKRKVPVVFSSLGTCPAIATDYYHIRSHFIVLGQRTVPGSWKRIGSDPEFRVRGQKSEFHHISVTIPSLLWTKIEKEIEKTVDSESCHLYLFTSAG